MNLSTVWTIFKKECLDTIRDRRTIIGMVILPLIMFPLIFMVMDRVISSTDQQAREALLKVAVFDRGNASEFESYLAKQERIELVEEADRDQVEALIRGEELDGAYVFASDFDSAVADRRSGRVTVYFKATDTKIGRNRMLEPIRQYSSDLLRARLEELQVSEEFVTAVDIEERNVASQKERLAQMVGGFLPYMFILFCFTGAMYPAIDLGAGEKERGTLETLLVSPAGRLEILLGKFGVVVLTGVFAACMSIVGLYIGSSQIRMGEERMGDVMALLEGRSIVLVLSLLIPLTVFFAGIMLSFSVFAKSFKEAQSIISPMIILVILPAAIGMAPGVELNSLTALAPILNVSLATKAIIAESITTLELMLTYLSLLVFAVLSLAFSTLWFGREGVIFR
ncbi:MAG TPA: ABC transporter permease [Acidobacteriota bacterium]|nr:ABC transporter permease [Acidobacteriota bacterium]